MPDRTTIRADDTDLSFVTIEIRDEQGILATTENRPVTVTVEGPGVLQGFGSARPDNPERYDTDTHHTFDGRILAVVRPTGAGPITVTATSAGLAPVTVTVTSQECP
ncbi:hypothetical protein [Curtobacterium sp. MCJR17_043]|uniref:hypothetical protein n=1 Tax=Curtobacterium sp. MCJR17_043 TaxID=2175660 RepID=UPI0024DFFE23|nr:hypothetical protein [Curtobacterium sp. MCJR17_043]WIB36060.1 hypothetical protein DEJ15_01915 [Curtobacterium sp. MCJR17_043]